MVPEGWKLTSLKEICSGQLQTGPFGSQLYASEYTNNGISVLMPKDLIGFRANTKTAAKITIEKANDLSKHILKDGDLLFSRRGDVTRFALIDAESKGSLCGTGCLKATPSEKHSSLFLSYFLQKDVVKRWLEQNAVGQTMPNMNTAILSELPLMTASTKSEEIKIAKILTTWDKAIETVEKLIENSRAQKKALMQQLLTGKKRLAGFDVHSGYKKTRYSLIPNDWQYVKIADIANQYTKKNDDNESYPVLSCSKHVGFVDSLEYFKKKVYSDNLIGYKLIPKGCFGFPSNHIEEGSIDCQNLYEFGLVSPIYTIFKPNNKLIDNKFLISLLKTEHYRQIFSASTNASVDRRGSLRWKEFCLIKVALPSLDEQQKIASVLTNADKEIELLEQQLSGLKQEKKSLMQQLLTGKRRVTIATTSETLC